MIINIWLKEQNIILKYANITSTEWEIYTKQNITCVSYEQKYICVNKDPMIHKCDCYQSTLKVTFVVLYIINYTCDDTKWLN